MRRREKSGNEVTENCLELAGESSFKIPLVHFNTADRLSSAEDAALE